MPFDSTDIEVQDRLIEVALKVRELLAKPNGWIQNNYRNRYGFCLTGAIWEVARQNVGNRRNAFQPTTPHESQVCHDLVAMLGFLNVSDAQKWNDRCYRRQDHILDRIDKAILEYKATKLLGTTEHEGN